ncbi:hypothetical protein HRbin36_00752 [bacterium HR36]|nr:hypothetical protein HRbin36_00752 [bacterium HR36]
MSAQPPFSRIIRSFAGRLVQLDLQQRTLMLEYQDDLHVFILGEDPVIFNGPDKTDPKRLQLGDELRVIYEVTQQGPIVLAVHVNPAQD